jgi:hypothetical protein
MGYKQRKDAALGRVRSMKVIRLGLEPRTHTLKVYCSTN